MYLTLRYRKFLEYSGILFLKLPHIVICYKKHFKCFYVEIEWNFLC